MKKIAKVLVLVLLFATVCTTKVKAEGEGITVYFYNSLGWDNVYIYSWSENSNAPEKTPMEAMEKNWYSFTFDETMGKKIEFLFYNGTWGKTNQTQNLIIKNGKGMYYFATNTLVDGENGKVAEAQGFAKKNDMSKAYKAYKAEQETVQNENKETKIYFRNAKGWENVYIWAWTADGTNIFDGEFPGKKMKKFDDLWYEYTIKDADTFKCIFSNGSNVVNEQTGDSEDITPGGTYWIRTAGNNQVGANADGLGGGAEVVVHRTPQAGWPGGPEVSEETTNIQEEKNNGGSSILMFAGGIILIVIVGVIVNLNHKKNNRVA